jgi:hypothetical protein
VIAPGAGRVTKDIDFLVDDAPDNLGRVRSALGVLADNAAVEASAEDVRRYSVVRIADEIVIGLMSRACGVTYPDAIADSEILEVDGVAVPIASRRTLIRTRIQFGRWTRRLSI